VTRPILRALVLGLSLGLLLVVAGLAVVLVVVPRATGSTPLTVLTSSMTPTLPPGTLVVVRPTAPADVRVGQIATYQLQSGRPEVVTHRVTAITTTSAGDRLFTFRGDANARADQDAVRAVQLRGTVWYSVPGLGWVNQAVDGPGRSWVVPSAAGALFAYAAVMILLGVREAVRPGRRDRGRRSASAPGRSRPRRHRSTWS
jgi:signal peptidase